MAKVSRKPAVDPMQPVAQIELDGKTYKLCFDLFSLAEAEDALLRAGREVNLLAAMPSLNLSSTLILFAAGLHRHHPEIAFDEARAMVTRENVFDIANAIAEAWTKSSPAVDPQKPVE